MAEQKQTPKTPFDEIRAELESLRTEVESLRAREAKHWKVTENFLSKFATYYDSSRQQSALFIIGQFVNGGGVNGLALTPQQGLIEQFALPICWSKDSDDAQKLLGKSPIVVPVHLPEVLETKVEEFGADAGSDTKTSD